MKIHVSPEKGIFYSPNVSKIVHFTTFYLTVNFDADFYLLVHVLVYENCTESDEKSNAQNFALQFYSHKLLLHRKDTQI